jgi:Aerotolerance regulator N-terminal/von Willebrand factor type A domain
MGFSLLHVGLAAGAALAVIPVILHLVLKQKPRHEMFPALRLIRQRHRVNLRKLQIRHWLLLAMRMLLIALMALALARPSIHGASFIPDQQAPVAAALVFDTSLSMEYRIQDRTRLEDAQAIAKGLLKEFPDGSEVLVLDSAEPTARFFPELSLAQQRIDSLRLRPRASSLNQAIIEASRGLAENERSRKEIYLFTDLTTGSLSREGANEIKSALESVKGGAAVYILNVGTTEPKNVFISEASTSGEVLPANSDARVRATVQDVGQGEEVLLELQLDGETRGTQQIALEKGMAGRAEFALPGLRPGIYRGKLILRNGGGLKFDDERFLAIEVRPVTRVLIVSDLERDSELFAAALAPDLIVQKQRARHHCERILSSRLGDKRLGDYDVVCLVNVQDLPASRWAELESFVASGGGLGVFLGSRVQPENYNQELAQDLLPVKIGKVVAPAEPVGMRAPAPSHPAIKKIHEWDPAALGQVIVERFVKAELSPKNANTVLEFSDGSIAIAERTPGGPRTGRVMLCTTAVHSTLREKPWNDLPQFDVLYVPLADGLINHLAGHAEQQLNYQVGQNVFLRPDRGQKLGFYLLHTPDSDEPTRRSADSSEGIIVVSDPETLGIYRVTAGQGEQAFEKAFSINANPVESQLEPISAAELNAVLGEGNFAVARTADQLREVMGDLRIGRELFPWVMPLLVLLFAAEHVLANRFYKTAEPSAAQQPRV